jgi:hypothetical protein
MHTAMTTEAKAKPMATIASCSPTTIGTCLEMGSLGFPSATRIAKKAKISGTKYFESNLLNPLTLLPHET